YGILFNRDAWRRVGLEREPSQWSDLADARLIGEVGLADPTKSGSVAKAFENIIQQQMQRRLQSSAGAPGRDDGIHSLAPAATNESRAIRQGWLDGMRMIQLIG